jgi:hypothetical protein
MGKVVLDAKLVCKASEIAVAVRLDSLKHPHGAAAPMSFSKQL